VCHRWLCNRKNDFVVSWSIFIEELITHYADLKSNTFFSQLINLKQRGSYTKHIHNFQKLSFRVENIPEDYMLDLFMGILKENIQHVVHLGNLSHWRRLSRWYERLKVKIQLLEGFPLTPTKREMFPLLSLRNLQGWHPKN